MRWRLTHLSLAIRLLGPWPREASLRAGLQTKPWGTRRNTLCRLHCRKSKFLECNSKEMGLVHRRSGRPHGKQRARQQPRWGTRGQGSSVRDNTQPHRALSPRAKNVGSPEAQQTVVWHQEEAVWPHFCLIKSFWLTWRTGCRSSRAKMGSHSYIPSKGPQRRVAGTRAGTKTRAKCGAASYRLQDSLLRCRETEKRDQIIRVGNTPKDQLHFCVHVGLVYFFNEV